MNASIQERLAQRRRGREERRQREQLDTVQQQQPEEDEVFFEAFGNSHPSMTKASSAGHLLLSNTSSHTHRAGMGINGMDTSSHGARRQNARFSVRDPSMDTSQRGSLLAATLNTPTVSRPSMQRQGSVVSLKPPPKDTRTYNNANPNNGTALAPPSKDTRPYSDDAGTVIQLPPDTNTTSRGREPRRGNLQRHRSRSLTDLRQFTAADSSRSIKQTPKSSRGSIMDKSNNNNPIKPLRGSKRISIKSLQIAPTIVTPSEVKLLSPQPASKSLLKQRRTSLQVPPTKTNHSSILDSDAATNHHLEQQLQSSTSTASTLQSMSTANTDLTMTDQLPRFDPYASPITPGKNIRKKRSGASKTPKSSAKTVKSENNDTARKPPRGGMRKSASRGSLLVDNTTTTNEPPTPRRLQQQQQQAKKMTPRGSGRKRVLQKRSTTMPPQQPQDDSPLKTHNSKGKRKSKQQQQIRRSKSINDGGGGEEDDLNRTNNTRNSDISLMGFDDTDDDDDDYDMLFTPHRTPGIKQQQEQQQQQQQQSAAGLTRVTSLPLTSQSSHGQQPPQPTNTEKPAPAPASRWSMANPDQVNKWKSKMATKTTTETLKNNSNTKDKTPPRQRRRNSCSNAISPSIARSSSFDTNNNPWFLGNEESEAPPPLMNLTREEQLQKKKSNGGSSNNNNKRTTLRGSKARSATTLEARNSNSNSNYPSMAIMSDNARNDVAGVQRKDPGSDHEARQRNSAGNSRRGTILDGSSKTLSSQGSAESGNKDEADKNGRSRSRSNGRRPDGSSLRHTDHPTRRKSKDKKTAEAPSADGPQRGNLDRTRSRSLSDLQRAGAAREEGQQPPQKSRAANKIKRHSTFHGTDQATPDLDAAKSKSARRVCSSDNHVGPMKKPSTATRKVSGSDSKSPAPRKKRESTRRSGSKTRIRDSATGRKSATQGDTKPESERGRSDKKKSERRGSKSPKDTARLKRGVARTRSSSLSDLRSPRLDTKKVLETNHNEDLDQSNLTMNDSIPTIGGGSSHSTSRFDNNKSRGTRKAKGQQQQPVSIASEEMEQSMTMHDSAGTFGDLCDDKPSPLEKKRSRGPRGPRKSRLQRSRTEDCTAPTNRPPSREPSPASHRRSITALLTPSLRPTLARHRSNSLSDLRAIARSFRKSKTSILALSTDEEEDDIKRLKASIEKLEVDLKNATVPLRSPEALKKHLEAEIKREEADQKVMKGKMFDTYQENIKLEDKLEKTNTYYQELQDIHNAEVMKNEALTKNVPVFEKVIEAHETKLARRNRYIDFERQTMKFYEDRINYIVQRFQEKCDDSRLVKTLQHMAHFPVPDDQDTVGTGATSLGSTVSPP
ncbi:expressed unknown protein [Seminavis robusta]|uniref:Uncharacterized protein n=1 Tax=Seminavis robusta TaxID=568900 RepID=A0A9N8DQV0_9STRA|nr:expressed unknown protein [Seminavis robusta]|eukprot:Sro306_g113090.1 n/a (1344) ;mRNA; f:59349-63521